MTKSRGKYLADRNMEATVWSKPGLPTDIWQRRIDARAANDVFVAALLKAQGK